MKKCDGPTELLSVIASEEWSLTQNQSDENNSRLSIENKRRLQAMSSAL